MLETAPSTVSPGVQTAVQRLVQTGDTRRHHRSPAAAVQIREELVLQSRLLLYPLRRYGGLTGGLQRVSILH